MREKIKLEDLKVGKFYQYKETDCGCTMFTEVKLLKFEAIVNDDDSITYAMECEIVRDLGSSPKIDLSIENNPHKKLSLRCTDKYSHYFKGRFYDIVDNSNVELADGIAQITLFTEDIPKVGSRMRGYIYNDTRNRFANGEMITTSRIESYDEETKIFKTRNTTYQII